jgi:nucleotide-binding universal stress UspA family protein
LALAALAVIVVRSTIFGEAGMTAQPGNGRHRIVVGVDGSVSSKTALAWALGQARLTGAVVEAVTAWEFPAVTGFPVVASSVDWEDLATQALGDAIADVTAGAEPVTMMPKVMEGNAAQVLVQESAGADLLVVGSRGRRGFVEALLGSTGQHCVHHACCPVVVIRDSATGRRAAAERA